MCSSVYHLADIAQPPGSNELGKAASPQLLLRGVFVLLCACEGISHLPGNGGILQVSCLGTASIYKIRYENVSLGCLTHLFKSLNNNQQ